MNYKDLPWFCSEPFDNVQTFTTGQGMICDWDTVGYNPNILQDSSILKLYNSNELRTVREEILAGKTPATSSILNKHCKTCYKLEQSNNLSWRKLSSKSFIDRPISTVYNAPQIRIIKLRVFGIQCSLQCLMCDETKSSSHALQHAKETGIPARLNQYEVWDKLDKKKLVEEISNLPYLKKIQFTSGEPIISDGVLEFLKLCVEYKLTNIEILLFTGSVNYSTELADILTNFDKIVFKHSIDGIGAVDELIRTGTVWTKKVKTIKKWQKSLGDKYIGISWSTIQALNAGDVKLIYDFCIVNNITPQFNLLIGPDYLSINALPKQIKKIYLSKIEKETDPEFNKIKHKLNETNSNQEYLWKQFKIFIMSKNKQDQLFQSHPELQPYF